MTSVPFHHALLGAALVAATLSAQAVVAVPPAAFSALYIFGDSLADSGNNALLIGSAPGQIVTGNTYVPSQPYGMNAYTNGQTWVSTVAAGLGLPASAVPSLLGDRKSVV